MRLGLHGRVVTLQNQGGLQFGDRLLAAAGELGQKLSIVQVPQREVGPQAQPLAKGRLGLRLTTWNHGEKRSTVGVGHAVIGLQSDGLLNLPHGLVLRRRI